MYRIDIEYHDFLGNLRIKECCFHLSQSELLEFEANTDHGLRKTITSLLSDDRDETDITKFMAMFIKASYGEISPDGEIFDKSEAVWNRFRQSPAYDKLFMQVISDDEKAVDLINGATAPL